MSPAPAPLPPERLRWRCDPDQLGFTTTEEVPPIETLVGQDRGLEAIEFGLALDTFGYNVFVAGPAGTGRSTAVTSRIKAIMDGRPTPADWVCLHNFADPYEPIAVKLPPGRGPQLAHDLNQFITAYRSDIRRLFDSEQFEQQRLEVLQAVQARREAITAELGAEAEQLGFMLQFTPSGISSAPFVTPGQPLSAEAFELLPDERKTQIQTNSQRLQHEIEEAMVALRRAEREGTERMRQLEREAALAAISHLLQSLRDTWSTEPALLAHFDAIRDDLLERLDSFRSTEPVPGQPPFPTTPPWDRHRANALVTHAPDSGPPIVYEPNPTYYNLLGRPDYRAAMGGMHTDYTLISPGALHRANGGYLILQARDVLLSPFAWEALKRSLRDGEIRIENLGEQTGGIPSSTMKPQPIPLKVKVVLIGDPSIYMQLYRMDDDFRKLFKVKAQFGQTMDATPEAIQSYARFVSSQTVCWSLLPFGADAVARVAEYGARLADHQGKLSTRFNVVSELVIEASHCARVEGAPRVAAAHVDSALADQERRVNLPEDEIEELIDEGTIAIDTTSSVVGQVNGLSILDLGDYAFARPSRITARVGMGSDGLVNIEREIAMSGPSHSKGVMILNGYLLGAYARERPLALSARLTFEQMYSGVDGDSASSTELYALLSAIADLPITQGIAVTGSVNQRGEIQAVGGVTTKIEGYFAVCKAQGLTGAQGVALPATNVPNLMLKQEVVDAVAAGRFHIWPVRTIDEGIELLTGVPAGVADAAGHYPDGSVHARVQQRLTAMSERLAQLGREQATLPAPR